MTLATLGFDMKRRWRKGDFAAPVPEGSVNREAVQEYSLGVSTPGMVRIGRCIALIRAQDSCDCYRDGSVEWSQPNGLPIAH